MLTSKRAADEWLSNPSEISAELYQAFGKDEHILIADIGACDGLSSVRYARMFPNAEIVAFEPLKKNVFEMQENFSRYGIRSRSTIHEYALSDKNGVADFWESYGQHPSVTDWDTGNKSSSLMPPTGHLKAHPWCKFRKVRVRTTKLDELYHGRIDFAHIDVQGAELSVLRGGAGTFSFTRLFWLEVADIELYAGQAIKGDIVRYMTDIGCECIKDTCKNKEFGDMLWMRK